MVYHLVPTPVLNSCKGFRVSDKAPTAAHKIDFVILTLETVDLIYCLSSSLSLLVGFSIQDEAMDVARSTTAGKEPTVLRARPTLTRFQANNLFTAVDNTPLLSK